MATAAATKRDTLNLRIKAEERSLIDRAAQSVGKTRTTFILDAARTAAEETLLDRTLLAVPAEAYQAFLDRLDATPRPNVRLKATMSKPAPWKKA